MELVTANTHTQKHQSCPSCLESYCKLFLTSRIFWCREHETARLQSNVPGGRPTPCPASCAGLPFFIPKMSTTLRDRTVKYKNTHMCVFVARLIPRDSVSVCSGFGFLVVFFPFVTQPSSNVPVCPKSSVHHQPAYFFLLALSLLLFSIDHQRTTFSSIKWSFPSLCGVVLHSAANKVFLARPLATIHHSGVAWGLETPQFACPVSGRAHYPLQGHQTRQTINLLRSKCES